MPTPKGYIIAALKTAIIYALFGGLWILLSDKLLGIMVTDLQTYAAIQTWKGWLYIVVTALLIYHLTLGGFRELASSREDLTASEERYRMAAKAAGLGTWEWDIPSGELAVNAEYLKDIGYDRSSFAPFLDNWKALLHPDDKPRVLKAIEEHLEGKSECFSSRYRMLDKQGEWRWIQDRGQVFLWDEDGMPLKAVGVHISIDADCDCKDMDGK
jgi:PAS domain S-box-containing protein